MQRTIGATLRGLPVDARVLVLLSYPIRLYVDTLTKTDTKLTTFKLTVLHLFLTVVPVKGESLDTPPRLFPVMSEDASTECYRTWITLSLAIFAVFFSDKELIWLI